MGKVASCPHRPSQEAGLHMFREKKILVIFGLLNVFKLDKDVMF